MADALSKPDPTLWRLRPRAPEPGAVLGPLEDVPDGDAKEYVFGRGTTVFSMFVVRRGEKVYGYLNICPHYSSPLNYRAGEFLNEDKSSHPLYEPLLRVPHRGRLWSQRRR